MSKAIVDLGRHECRYPLTNGKPHLFCAASTALTAAGAPEPYCPTHKKLCHRGHGKDWQSLAEMMRLTEQTIRKAAPSEDLATPVDEAVTGKRADCSVCEVIEKRRLPVEVDLVG